MITSDFDIEKSFDNAFDIQNIVVDAALGGAFGGIQGVKKPGIVDGELLDNIPDELPSGVNKGGSNAPNGVGDNVITNKGNAINTKPYDNHSTVNKNPGYKGDPNTSVDILDRTGTMETRRWFGDNANAFRDVDMTNHGNPKLHPEWPHEHFWKYGPDGKPNGR